MLGSIWPSAAVLIVPTALSLAGGALFDGGLVGLRALGLARRSMPIRIARASAWVVGGIVGAFLGGAAGSVWGTAAANLLADALVWWQLRIASRANLAGVADSSDAAADQLS
jgi:hypothetical protein